MRENEYFIHHKLKKTNLEGEQETVVLSDEIVSDIGDSDLDAEDEVVSEGLFFRYKTGLLVDTTVAELITGGCFCFPAGFTKLGWCLG